MSWMIVLFGCEVSFYLQNYRSYQNNKNFSELSFSLQKAIALQIMHLLVHGFVDKKPALTAYDIARELALPVSAVQMALARLEQIHIIAELKTEEGEDSKFQPALDIGQLSVAFVINALERYGQDTLSETTEIEQYLDIVEEIEVELNASYADRLLRDI